MNVTTVTVALTASFMGTLNSDAKVAYFCHKKKSSGSLTDSVKFCCKINVLN